MIIVQHDVISYIINILSVMIVLCQVCLGADTCSAPIMQEVLAKVPCQGIQNYLSHVQCDSNQQGSAVITAKVPSVKVLSKCAMVILKYWDISHINQPSEPMKAEIAKMEHLIVLTKFLCMCSLIVSDVRGLSLMRAARCRSQSLQRKGKLIKRAENSKRNGQRNALFLINLCAHTEAADSTWQPHQVQGTGH